MRSQKILVVDDDPDVVEYLSSFLEDEGYLVRAAGDAVDARSMLETFRPDVILIDVMLPGKSGLDLLVALRRSETWSGLPIILVTGDDQVLQENCQSYLETHRDVRGPEDVLGKPIERDKLLAALREVGPDAPSA
jgi:CheY-like chemotaxis protein